MMAEKRKHEDNKQERKTKIPKTEIKSKSQRSFQKQKRNQKRKKNITLIESKDLPKTVTKVKETDTSNNVEQNITFGQKPKVWKHWERLKKRNKNKSSVNTKSDSCKPQTSECTTNTSKSVPIHVASALSPKKAIQKKEILVSANWKKLKMDINKTKKKKKNRKKDLQKKIENKVEKKEETSAEPDIWFDDVDVELINPKKDTSSKGKTVNKSTIQPTGEAGGLVKQHAFKGLTKAVALDCEMVGVGEAGKESILARVSVVNQHGECLYDTFVRSREEVVDYRTRWSGVTPEKLQNATDFLDAQKRVSDILHGRILVGHAVHHDLKVLFLDHPKKDIRDTSSYKPYRQLFKGRTPSLKNLTSRLLNVKIQSGEHNSVTDAQAAMRLYTFSRQEWEKHRRKKRFQKAKSSKKTKTKQ